MHEHHGGMLSQNKIRLPGQLSVMQPETESPMVQFPAHDQLRPGILPPDSGHHLRAGFLVDNIDHAANGSGSTETDGAKEAEWRTRSR